VSSEHKQAALYNAASAAAIITVD